MRATVKIAEVRDHEAIRLFDAPVCKFLEMQEGRVGVPKHSLVIKYRHDERTFIRVLGAKTSETRCLRARLLEEVAGASYLDEHSIGDLHCRVIQPNESFEITVHEL